MKTIVDLLFLVAILGIPMGAKQFPAFSSMFKQPIEHEIELDRPWDDYTIELIPTENQIYYTTLYLPATNVEATIKSGTSIEILEISGSHNKLCFEGGSQIWIVQLSGDNNTISLPNEIFQKLRIRPEQFSSKEHISDTGNDNRILATNGGC